MQFSRWNLIRIPHALRISCPIPPPMGRLKGRAKLLSPKLSLFLALLLKIIKQEI
jgi:hypothetical protein